MNPDTDRNPDKPPTMPGDSDGNRAGAYALIEEYLTAVRSGAVGNRDEWLRLHPEAHPEALAYLQLLDLLPAVLDGPTAPLPRLLGEYELLEPLGAGGMGMVYKARHKRLDKLVALKLLPSFAQASPDRVARFLRETKAVGSLEHPNVVEAHDAGEEAGVVYLVMKLIDGADLAAVVKERGPLPIAEACELARQTALGLQYLHERGLIHRDLKPSNLMRTRSGTVKILDLGLARWRAEKPGQLDLTGADQLIGTPDFLAPEQVRGKQLVDIRADLYGLGGTLFFLLTGRPPFGHLEGVYEKLEAHQVEAPPDVRTLRPEVPAALAELVLRLLAKNPADRPCTPADVANALGEYAEPITQGTPTSAALAFAPQGTRLNWLWLFSGLGISAFVLAVAFWLWPRDHSARPGFRIPGTSSASSSDLPGLKLGLQLKLSASKKGNQKRLHGLDEPGVLPLRPDDGLRVEARTLAPTYFYALNMTADGSVLPMHPWRKNAWRDLGEETKRDFFCMPPEGAGDAALLLPGPSGIESVVVLARETALTAGERDLLRKALGGWPLNQGTLDPLRAAAYIGPNDLRFGALRDQETRGAIALDRAIALQDPVLRVRRLLQKDLGALGLAARAVCYPFQSK